jgi:outer membrane protein TolC
MNKMKSIYISLVVLLFLGQISFAQEMLTLEQCRSLAIEQNNAIKKARLQKDEAVANIKTARTAYLPSLSAAASWTYMMQMDDITMPGNFLQTAVSEEAAKSGSFSGTTNIWSPGMELELGNISYISADITVSQSIYAGGRIRFLNEQADEGAKISNLSFNLTYAEVIELTDQAYWNVAAIQANVVLAERYIQMLKELEQQMKDMFEVGLTPASERLKVSVQKNEAELDLLKANNALKISKMYLNQIIGRGLNTEIHNIEKLSTDINLYELSMDVQEAAESRNELQILDKQLNVSELEKKMIKADYLPQLGVGASYSTMSVNKLEDNWNLQPTVSAQLSIPIFNWGQSKHKQTAAQLRIRQLESDRKNTRELISLEIQQVRIKVQEAYEAILLAKRNIKEADESLIETKNSFEVGLNTTSDLLNAQAYWQGAQAQLITALADYEVSQTQWLKATAKIVPNSH